MSTERSQRPQAGRAITIAILLLTTPGPSCSPRGAGSISVPSGKGKLKAASKIGSVKPEPGSIRPTQTSPRRR